MSHRNIVSTIVGLTASVPKLSPNDIYLAYLPLAHILELTGEVINPCDFGMQGLGNMLMYIYVGIVDCLCSRL